MLAAFLPSHRYTHLARKTSSPEVYKFGGSSLGDASAFLNAA